MMASNVLFSFVTYGPKCANYTFCIYSIKGKLDSSLTKIFYWCFVKAAAECRVIQSAQRAPSDLPVETKNELLVQVALNVWTELAC